MIGSKFVRSDVLESLRRNSLESIIESLHDAVLRSDCFGDGEKILFSTYGDRVVVFCDGIGFVEAKYSIRKDVVEFEDVNKIDVDFLDEENIVSSSVDSFFDRSDFGAGLRDLVFFDKVNIEDIDRKIERKIEFGKWKLAFDLNSDWAHKNAWDPEYGRIEKFDRRYYDVNEDRIDRSGLRSDLVRIASKLDGMISGLSDLGEECGNALKEYRDDFVQYLNKILIFVRESVQNIDSGEQLIYCSRVHCKIAENINIIDLAHRLFRKVSNRKEA